MAAAGVVVAAGLALVACGEDDGADEGRAGGPASGDADLTVEAHDNDLDRDSYRLGSGEQQVAYVQQGETRHTLLVETEDGDVVDGFELEVNGQSTDTGDLDLAPGRYTFYCDVSGHRDAGMEAELVVE